MKSQKTMCLCMIVRDESHVIARALQSIKDHIDYWVICDTGSSDDTPAIILNELHHIPGELHSETWTNFGINRTSCIQKAKDKSDYILIMDADMIAHVAAPFKSDLSADAYNIRYKGTLDYSQPMLVSNQHDWSFIGVTHEYIYAATATSSDELSQLSLEHLADGGNRVDKFERDLKLLFGEWKKDNTNPRTAFYIAQSYFNLENYKAALYWYTKRVELAGWDEEKWFARFQIGRMQLLLDYPIKESKENLLNAFEMRPWRLEPIYLLAKHYRETEQYAKGYLYAQIINSDWVYPKDHLFIEQPVYSYLLLLEFGICAYAIHKNQEAITAFNQILEIEGIPEEIRASALDGLSRCNYNHEENG